MVLENFVSFHLVKVISITHQYLIKLFQYSFFKGASEPCCQGSNPTPVVDAMCGFFFTVNVNAANQVQAPVCGKYDKFKLAYQHFAKCKD